MGSVGFFAILYALYYSSNCHTRSFYFDPQDFAHYEKEALGERELPLPP